MDYEELEAAYWEKCAELEAARCERDQWRALAGDLLDAADEIRGIAARRMPSGGKALADK